MSDFVDQLGNQIPSKVYSRIVSLVPSQTELLFDLGLDEVVIGITKFCVHPHTWYKTKQRIGGTKNVNLKKIGLLKPDLIIANKEENVKEQVEALRLIAPVYVSDIQDLESALQMIEQVGMLTNKSLRANAIVNEIEQGFESIKPSFNSINKTINTAYLIWKDPYMGAGGDTFINDMLIRCGLQNVFATSARYPICSIEQLNSLKCDLILLSSEPYPFQQKHINELKVYLPDAHIMLVDGEMFSWYGSRLLKAPAYFKQLIAQVYQET